MNNNISAKMLINMGLSPLLNINNNKFIHIKAK
jgi:predicted nucleic-acid-binding Zn-ribbon protein